MSNTGPLAARRQLGAALRRLRDQRAMTAEEVGGHLDCHLSKVTRLEQGKRACTKRDFEALMDLYGVEAQERERLHALMLRGRQRVAPWWHAYRDVISANYDEFLTYEAEASRCLEYQPLLIPAQLQTEDYARAVTGVGFAALGPDQVDSLVEVKLKRQARLREEPPLEIRAVITEAALRFHVGGPAVMRDQLRALTKAAAAPHASLRVIPCSAGEKGIATGAFTLFGIGNDADVAFVESAEVTTFRDEPLTLRRLNRLFKNLSEAALPEQDSLDLVKRIERELI
ncbi:helix-turn-helix domain-containing protein [Wenjunlia vitaminophila]|uniref:helix-turn-helix domain-containing protein n=1 Tax=Wenjunlia vitaminophila TaxID=76728 RepID=UPI00039CA5F5|nr:helix-turn-helix transcriptional regulator [Wenjunlia vitaminophila]